MVCLLPGALEFKGEALKPSKRDLTQPRSICLIIFYVCAHICLSCLSIFVSFYHIQKPDGKGERGRERTNTWRAEEWC